MCSLRTARRRRTHLGEWFAPDHQSQQHDDQLHDIEFHGGFLAVHEYRFPDGAIAVRTCGTLAAIPEVDCEAARVAGTAAAQVLGRDDSAIFAREQASMIRANDERVMAQARPARVRHLQHVSC